jgi:hypothetical protein
MRVMVIVKASKESESGELPNSADLDAMGRFNDELIEKGVMLSGEGLLASSEGKRVKVSGSKATVTDGPFKDTRELVAGFWILKVKSMDEAVSLMKKVPAPVDGSAFEVEIRQVAELEDFGDAATPEIRAREERQRERLETSGRSA